MKKLVLAFFVGALLGAGTFKYSNDYVQSHEKNMTNCQNAVWLHYKDEFQKAVKEPGDVERIDQNIAEMCVWAKYDPEVVINGFETLRYSH